MRNRNLLYTGKLAIVLLVSSTLQKDGFSPPRLFRWAFFGAIFLASKEKTRIVIDAGFPVFSLPSLKAWILCSDHEGKCIFCLHATQHSSLDKKKPAGLIAAG
jgi:hypothetical protein